MTTTEFVQQAFRAATGKLPTFPVGSTKWNNLVSSGNFYIDQWSRELNVDWNSLYDPAFSIGTVTTEQTYDLDETIRKISQQEDDFLRIVHTNGTQWTDYDLVKADRLRSYDESSGHYAAQVGRTVRFNKAFLSSNPQYGGEIFLPVYLFPEKMVAATGEVPVDDPNWLVFVVAADYVRNDITRKDLRADLISEANGCMERMKQDNEAQLSEVLRPWNPLARVDTDGWGD